MTKAGEKKEINKFDTCPFCLESGFDKGGLAYHLIVYCKEIRKEFDEFVKPITFNKP